MEGLLVILLLLACPLSMVVIGLGAWVVTRTRGEKGDHEYQQPMPGQAPGAGLEAHVTRLQREVEGLRRQTDGTGPSGVDERSIRAAREGNQRD